MNDNPIMCRKDALNDMIQFNTGRSMQVLLDLQSFEVTKDPKLKWGGWISRTNETMNGLRHVYTRHLRFIWRSVPKLVSYLINWVVTHF